MSLVIPANFHHILRVLNTNIEGKRNVMFALTAIKGIGRRYANMVLKKVSLNLSEGRTRRSLMQVVIRFCSLVKVEGQVAFCLPVKARPAMNWLMHQQPESFPRAEKKS